MPAAQPHHEVRARRLWLPWRPRFRLILAYPRGWHYVVVWLDRFDMWVTRRYTGRARPVAVAVFFPPWYVARFLGLVAVLEVTIIAFAASIYLVWAEWLVLVLLFPFALVARLAHALPWPLLARAGERWWTTRVSGWEASQDVKTGAVQALSAGAEPRVPPWSLSRRTARVWM